MKKITLLALLSVFLFSFSPKGDDNLNLVNNEESSAILPYGPDAFVTRWKTYISEIPINDRITIPTVDGETYNYSVDWGDGNSDTGVTGDITHIYDRPGSYTVSITGMFPRIRFKSINRNRLLKVLQWGDIQWSSMEGAFSRCENLDVTTTDSPNLFQVSSVEDMFQSCFSLVGTASFRDWDMSGITNASGMFDNAYRFNQPIDNWNVGNVQRFDGMFFGATIFNQDIGSWDVSSATTMQSMFDNADSFDQNLGSWDVSNLANMTNMFLGTALSVENYDALLMGWSSLPSLQNGVPFDGGDSQYCDAEAARQKLIDDFGWTITDGGQADNCSANEGRPFVTTWKTDNGSSSTNHQIKIPTNEFETYDYTVDWGDGTSNSGVTSNIIHTYASPGTYQVSISGLFPRIYFDNGGGINNDNSSKLISVDQWGDINWKSFGNAFAGCGFLDVKATDVPDLSDVSSMEYMFYFCTILIGNSSFSNWDVSQVTNMRGLFAGTDSFNQDIGNWNVSRVTNMIALFGGTDIFNQDISAWDVGNVTNMSAMFSSAGSFNEDIGNWNVANVTDMSRMFRSSPFDQDIGNWDISNVESMTDMFEFADGLSTENYDKLLQGWGSRQSLQANVTFNSGPSNYCLGEESRQKLIDDFGWAITDGGKSTNCEPVVEGRPLITRWKTYISGTQVNDRITIPTVEGETYNYTVDWGDGNTDSGITGDITHIYDNPGSYTVTINGTFPRIQFKSINRNRLLKVMQWGDIEWSSMERAFKGCTNLDVAADDVPNLSSVTNLNGMFWDCTTLKGNSKFNEWDVSQVTNIGAMFSGATLFNQPIGNWDVSSVTSMVGTFAVASSFNQNLQNWDVRNVLDMESLFAETAFNQPIGTWNVGNVQSAFAMFNGATAFDQNLGNWDVSSVTDMSFMFSRAKLSNENYDALLEGWSSLNLQNDVQFSGGDSQYCDAEMARQKLINDFGWTIRDAGQSSNCEPVVEGRPFITRWKTYISGTPVNDRITIPTVDNETYNYSVDWGDGSTNTRVTGDITHVYDNPGSYTISINGTFPRIKFKSINRNRLLEIRQWGDIEWSSMEEAFSNCQNLDMKSTDAPNLTNVGSLAGMFSNCATFRGNDSFGNWEVSNTTNMNDMFNGLTLTTEIYEALLNGWSNLPNLQSGVVFDGGNSQYCEAEPARQKLLDDFGWIITDGGKTSECSNGTQRPFITIWKTDNVGPSNDNQITIPTFSGETYNYTVDWGDGLSDSGVTGNITHTYSSPGTYQVVISGDFPRIYFQGPNPSVDDQQKIVQINQWGDIAWSSMASAFAGCSNLDVVATDVPDLSRVTSLQQMFDACTSLVGNPSISNWDVGNVTSLSGLFFGASQFNQNIGGWNVSNVQDFSATFSGTSFNQFVGGWNVGNGIYFDNMFEFSPFNHDIGNWDVSNGIGFGSMFNGASNFNQNIGGWNVSKAQYMNTMFFGASAFNQDLSLWDVSQVTNMQAMFYEAISFDQDLGNWDISGVRSMNDIFNGVTLTVENYDALLNGWGSVSNLQTGVNFNGGNSQYCMGEEARQKLIDDYGWTITDGGKTLDCEPVVNGRPFITRWKTYISETPVNDRITIPTVEGETYNYTVDWGDGTTDSGVTGDITHIYDNPGSYTVSINGTFPRIKFKSVNRNRLLKVWQWGDIQWSSMESAFSGCKSLDVTATDVPDLSQVTSLESMFFGCNILEGNDSFNDWDVSTITNLNNTFGFTFVFNQTLNSWDVSYVTDMTATFTDAFEFNQPLGNWDVSNVMNMAGMFANAFRFNQDIGNWDVGQATNMEGMFTFATDFNQDISNWDVGNVENMKYMFFVTPTFNQNIGNWQVQNVSNFEDMFIESNLSVENYDALLQGWSSLTGLQTGMNFGAGNSQYCNGEAARQKLIDDFGWTIIDGGVAESCDIGEEERPFVTTWKTDNPGTSNDNQITIPTFSGETYNYNVDWGDGSSSLSVTGEITHTYNSLGTYTVSITGNFPRIYFNNNGEGSDNVGVPIEGDKDKIIAIDQWGDILWNSMSRAFYGCSNLVLNTNDIPNLTLVEDVSAMFKNCTELLTSGNQSIANWDTSQIRLMDDMFLYGSSLNLDVSNWNVSQVESMKGLFAGATDFNHDISNWDVANVRSMERLFQGASSFDQDISGWNVTNVESMYLMFGGATTFNQPIGNWDVRNVINMTSMFSNATSFNQDIGLWNVGNVVEMGGMFSGASSFNQPIGNWNTSNVIRTSRMFRNATAFNQDLSSWDLSEVFTMSEMFRGAWNFNQPIGNWNVSKVRNMRHMFSIPSKFNQDIGSWDVSSVQDMTLMFNGNSSFDQDLGAWDVSNVWSMNSMLLGVTLSTENYDSLLEGWNSLPSLRSNVIFDAGNSQYCNGAVDRQHMIDLYGWEITDGGENCSASGKTSNITTSTELEEEATILSFGQDSGVLEGYGTFNMSMYPNPSSEIVNISFDQFATINEFMIFDVQGRLVQTINTSDSGPRNDYQLNVRTFVTGTYFLRAFDEVGRVHQKQLLIRR